MPPVESAEIALPPVAAVILMPVAAKALLPHTNETTEAIPAIIFFIMDLLFCVVRALNSKNLPNLIPTLALM